MTNHHCARACVESATRPGEDLLRDGFYAARREDERACEGLFLDQLQEITDVTDRVAGALPRGQSPKAAAEERRIRIQALEKACSEAEPHTSCQVVTMYRGGQYKLYRFRRYDDVRLVFAVESQIAFFGGDPDNFTYPRFDLDMAFVRAYEGGKPAPTEHHFGWSPDGAREGELVFVTGNPGSTGRLNTMAQLEFLRDVQYPAQLDQLRRQIAVFHALSEGSEERADALRNTLFGLENTQKAIAGYQSGLLDPRLMAQKRRWEQQFRAKVAGNPKLRAQYGAAWQTIAAVRQRAAAIDVRRRYHGFSAYGTRLLTWAAQLTRYHAETAKPDSARLPAYQEASRAALERGLYGGMPLDAEREIALLAAYFAAMEKELPAADPVRRAVFKGRTAEQAAREMVEATSIKTAEARKGLVEGGAAAVARSSDPFLVLARLIDPLERTLTRELTELNDREAQANEQVARALLAVFGNSVAPDATFSLRISDGEVRRYPMNGTVAPPFTTFYGLYDRSASFGGAPPFDLPERWVGARDSLNLALAFNSVSTADIIGGNSGSPVLNRDAQVVGLIFDGNIEMLPNRFLYTERVARSVYVDSRAIMESLRRVYGARALADELAGPGA